MVLLVGRNSAADEQETEATLNFVKASLRSAGGYHPMIYAFCVCAKECGASCFWTWTGNGRGMGGCGSERNVVLWIINYHRHGVGIGVSKDIMAFVTNFIPVSDQLQETTSCGQTRR